MSAQGFKLDVLRIERIKDQLDRGEEITAEDLAYVRECFEVLMEILRPLLDALKKDAKLLATAIAASRERVQAAEQRVQAAEQRSALYAPVVAAVSRRGVNNMADVVRRAGRERRR